MHLIQRIASMYDKNLNIKLIDFINGRYVYKYSGFDGFSDIDLNQICKNINYCKSKYFILIELFLSNKFCQY